MFSGIVEEYGTVVSIEKEQENYHFTLTCSFVNELKVDQSLAHNGVCLTVVKVDKDNETYVVTAIKETLSKTNLGTWEVGSKVNLERSMMMNGRLDGHIVQGHVDQTATCTKVEEADGSWYYTFEYVFNKEAAKQGYMTVEKGSVTVNGGKFNGCEFKRQFIFRWQLFPTLRKSQIFILSKKGQSLTWSLILLENI